MTHFGQRRDADHWLGEADPPTPREVPVREAEIERIAAAVPYMTNDNSFPAGTVLGGHSFEDWRAWYRVAAERLYDAGLRSQQYLDGLVAAGREVLEAMGERPPEGPEPTTAEVERWYITNDGRIIRALAALRTILEGARATDDEGQQERG